MVEEVQRVVMSFCEQTLAGTHHPRASGDPSTSGDYRWGAHSEALKRSGHIKVTSPHLLLTSDKGGSEGAFGV